MKAPTPDTAGTSTGSEKRGRGRPSEFTPEIGEQICNRIAMGETMTKICRSAKMPDRSTVWRWTETSDEFCNALARARALQAWSWADESVDIADRAGRKARGAPGTGEAGAKVNAEKLRVDVRKWLISKLNPKKFGDKVTQEISGPDGKPIETITSVHSAEIHTAEAISELLRELTASVHDPEERERILSRLPERTSDIALRMDQAARIAATVEPPASFRGVGSEE